MAATIVATSSPARTGELEAHDGGIRLVALAERGIGALSKVQDA
jgi:hypothetical protein